MLMLDRFEKFLRWLPKPNITLLLNPGLGPTINRGGDFQTSRNFFPSNFLETYFSEYTAPEEDQQNCVFIFAKEELREPIPASITTKKTHKKRKERTKDNDNNKKNGLKRE